MLVSYAVSISSGTRAQRQVLSLDTIPVPCCVRTCNKEFGNVLEFENHYRFSHTLERRESSFGRYSPPSNSGLEEATFERVSVVESSSGGSLLER